MKCLSHRQSELVERFKNFAAENDSIEETEFFLNGTSNTSGVKYANEDPKKDRSHIQTLEYFREPFSPYSWSLESIVSHESNLIAL